MVLHLAKSIPRRVGIASMILNGYRMLSSDPILGIFLAIPGVRR
jgi:hypothetical protein